MNVARFLLSIIRRLGTDTVFSLTGGMAMHINHAVSEMGFTAVYGNHEQAVAAGADGYARAKDFKIPGLAVVTSGPGVTNTITAVASAYYDSVPLFVLAGQTKTTDINQIGVRSRGAQETPQIGLMTPVTKAALRYIPAEVSDEQLAASMALALTGRKGPVFIEIPLDVQPQIIERAAERVDAIVARIQAEGGGDQHRESAAAASIETALVSAARPLLVIGNGTRISGISRERLQALIESLRIPTLFTWASFDLLDYQHALNFGCAGGLAPVHANRALQNADLVVFLGVRLDLLTTAFSPENYGRNAKRLVVECDPAEITKNAGMHGTTFFCEDVADVVAALESRAPRALANADWLLTCQHLRREDRQAEEKAFGGGQLNIRQVAKVLSAAATSPHVVCTASGFAIEGLARFFAPRQGASFTLTGHCLGAMGLGLPTAIGVAAGLHGPVICVEGDGGLLLNVQELATLRANPWLDVTLVVLNNGGYQSIQRSDVRAFGKEFGASSHSGLCEVRFDLLAELADMRYVKCATLTEFERAMAEPSQTRRCFIDVILEEDGYRGPCVTTKFDANGTPYSTDIGEVCWNE